MGHAEEVPSSTETDPTVVLDCLNDPHTERAVEEYLTRLEAMDPSPRLQRAIDVARAEFRATLNVIVPADQEVVTLRAEVERLREVAHQAEVDRDDFAQAMWDARGILGFDQDGDASPHYADPADYTRFFLADMREMRKDYDDACDETP